MSQYRFALREYPQRVEPNTIRESVLGYSDTELGTRHPSLPVGYMVRDTGQFDLYAGSVRVIGGLNGGLFFQAGSLLLKSQRFDVLGVNHFEATFDRKRINPELGVNKIVTIKPSVKIEDYSVLGPNARVDLTTGEILDKVKLSSVFTVEDFLTGDILLDTPEVDHYNSLVALLGD